jgi:hypothetical protein
MKLVAKPSINIDAKEILNRKMKDGHGLLSEFQISQKHRYNLMQMNQKEKC